MFMIVDFAVDKLNPSNDKATSSKHKDEKVFENHLNTVISVFIG